MMRLTMSMTVGVLALVGLSACGQNEEAQRATYRTQALANCRAGSTPAAERQLAAAGISAEQLCTCAIDRYMRAASLEQLKRESSTEMPAGLQTTTTQCVSEMVRRPAPGATPGANEAAPAAEAPPAAPEQEGAAEESGPAEENGAAEE